MATMPDGPIASAARRVAADIRRESAAPDGMDHWRGYVALLPFLDAVAAGQGDEGRVERWARELCRISGFDPDTNRHDPNGSQSEWTFHRDDARAAMALADAENGAIMSKNEW